MLQQSKALYCVAYNRYSIEDKVPSNEVMWWADSIADSDASAASNGGK